MQININWPTLDKTMFYLCLKDPSRIQSFLLKKKLGLYMNCSYVIWKLKIQDLHILICKKFVIEANLKHCFSVF
jgi:hypothetical protein